MALTECNECGNRISDKASVCPHCGIKHYEHISAYNGIFTKTKKLYPFIIVPTLLAVIIFYWNRFSNVPDNVIIRELNEARVMATSIISKEKIKGFKECYDVTAKVPGSNMKLNSVPVEHYVLKFENNKIVSGTQYYGGLLERTAKKICE